MSKQSRNIALLLAVLLVSIPIFRVATGIFAGYPPTSFSLMVRKEWMLTILIEVAVIIFAICQGMTLANAAKQLPRPTQIAVAIWLASVGLSTALAAKSVAIGVHHAGVWTIHLLFAASLWSIVTNLPQSGVQKTSIKLAVYFVISALVSIAAMAIFIALYRETLLLELVSETPGFSNIRHWGQFLIPALAIGGGMVLFAKDRKWVLPAMALYTLILIATFWAGHRGAVASHLLGLLLLAMILPAARSLSYILKQSACWITTIIISLYITFPSHPSFHVIGRVSQKAGGGEAVSNGRSELWAEAFQMILNRPWGHGSGQYRWTAPGAMETFNHPHNAILQMGFDWGVAGMGAIMFLLLLTAWSMWQKRDKMNAVAITAALICISIGAWAMIDGALYYPMAICFFIMAAVIALTQQKQPNTID